VILFPYIYRAQRLSFCMPHPKQQGLTL
jgi:hypothetical protein